MKRITGLVQVQEPLLVIPNLVVGVFDSDLTTRNSRITAALGKLCAMVANSVLMSVLVDHKSTMRGSAA